MNLQHQSFHLLVALFCAVMFSLTAGQEKSISTKKNASMSFTMMTTMSSISQEMADEFVLEARNGPGAAFAINSEDREKLRKSLIETMRKRRVTATMPTMSPLAISTPNVLHFFSRNRFNRTRNQMTTAETPTTEPTVTSTRLSLSPAEKRLLISPLIKV